MTTLDLFSRALGDVPKLSCGAIQPGTTPEFSLECLRTSAKCFALPYGGLGFVSHILTYYCLVMNLLERTPLRPWKHAEHSRWNLFLGCAALIITTVTAVLATRRCNNKYDLEFLNAWLICTSVASAVAGIMGRGTWLFMRSRWWFLRSRKPADDQLDINYHPQPLEQNLESSQPVQDVERRERWGQRVTRFAVIGTWLTGGILGLLASLNSLILTWKAAPEARKVTFGFAGCLPVAIFCAILLTRCWVDIREKQSRLGFTGKLLFLVFLYSLFYIDWLVAAILKNWSGIPTKLDKAGQILYWTYFASKRLTLFNS